MAKGSSFERDICKQLSLWWTDYKRDDVFWRTAGSGARATVRSKKKKGTFGQHGDVQATDPIGQPLMDIFSIELKRGYTQATASNAFDASKQTKKHIFLEFVEQAEQSRAGSSSRFWMLIHKRDRRETLVTIPYTAAKILRLRKLPHILMSTDGYGILQIKFSAFLKKVTPDKIRSMI